MFFSTQMLELMVLVRVLLPLAPVCRTTEVGPSLSVMVMADVIISQQHTHIGWQQLRRRECLRNQFHRH